MEKVVAIIPALEDMNAGPIDLTRLFCGRPLIFWTLDALEQCSKVKQIIVATNSDAAAASLFRMEFSKMAIYRTEAPDVVTYERTEVLLLEYLRQSRLANEDIFMLVDYTFPLHTSTQFGEALDLMHSIGAFSLFSAVRNRHFCWTHDGISISYNYRKRPSKEEQHKELLETEGFYISKVGSFIANINRLSGKIAVYEMPSYTAFQLRDPLDWKIGEFLMHQYRIDHSREEGFGRVKLVVSDVDGVMTDGSMYYTEKGDEIKRFHTYDGMAFGLIREQGIKTAIITSEDTQMVNSRAKKLKIDYLYQGRRHGGKLAAIQDICEKEGISLSDVVYIGDDINCREALSAVGFAFCPANALPDILALPNIIYLETKGGSGVVREVYEKYLRPSFE
ncbi:MAG: HAD hydrolase family protein [Saprospiraceae bacterium]|nr:HAD hydrolase family protein [Saprospiraceae bacterium]